MYQDAKELEKSFSLDAAFTKQMRALAKLHGWGRLLLTLANIAAESEFDCTRIYAPSLLDMLQPDDQADKRSAWHRRRKERIAEKALG